MHWRLFLQPVPIMHTDPEGFIMMQVEAMLTEGGGSIEQLRTAWKHIGDACAWRGQWKQV